MAFRYRLPYAPRLFGITYNIKILDLSPERFGKCMVRFGAHCTDDHIPLQTNPSGFGDAFNPV